MQSFSNFSLSQLIYASHSSTRQKSLWPHLCHLAASITHPWLLMGDFNSTLDTSERKGGASSTRSSHDLQNFLFDCGLRDLGFQGPSFTWSRGCTHARLDRMICNTLWDECYLESLVTHLLRMRSDHRPLLLRVGHAHRTHLPRNFKYFTGWQHHIDFDRMVQDNWQSGSTLAAIISKFTDATTVWNKGILDQEEQLWRQKSQVGWVTKGDRNTTYFHRKSNQRKVPPSTMNLLVATPTSSEIRDALSDMSPLKSLGPDELHAKVFQK
ncbi:hypothetical protein V6N13_046999 [Hibiscus sabdariffa]